jgi:hypothetical protein
MSSTGSAEEVGERLARATELALVDLTRRPQRGSANIDEALLGPSDVSGQYRCA